MKPRVKETPENELRITQEDFLKSYNATIPLGFPRATKALLNAFKDANPSLFKHGDSWSLDTHRKKIMDWLPMNILRAAHPGVSK